MGLWEWLVRPPTLRPRTYEQIRYIAQRDVAQREESNIERLNRVDQSLLRLTAEVGLDDLRRRLEAQRDG